MVKTYKRYRRKLQSEINMIPLIDVLLVLLLIFMASTPVMTQQITVDLPKFNDSKNLLSAKNLPIILEISGVNQYTILINHHRITLLTLKQIEAEVKARLIANPNTVFLIGGVKNIPYDEIIKALNMFSKMGVTSVGLMTQAI